MEDKNWILSMLTINQDWGKPGVYKGNVKFQNNIKLEFSMLLDEVKCAKIMAILRDEIVESAKTITEAMVNSMPIALPVKKEDSDEVKVCP